MKVRYLLGENLLWAYQGSYQGFTAQSYSLNILCAQLDGEKVHSLASVFAAVIDSVGDQSKHSMWPQYLSSDVLKKKLKTL